MRTPRKGEPFRFCMHQTRLVEDSHLFFLDEFPRPRKRNKHPWKRNKPPKWVKGQERWFIACGQCAISFGNYGRDFIPTGHSGHFERDFERKEFHP
jgi:hypothetical protein